MASQDNVSQAIHPFKPTLFHLALVRTALPLLNDFDIKTLESAFMEIQKENSTHFNKGKQENCSVNRAKEKLLFIPAGLRHSVLKAVIGMHFAVKHWQVFYCRHYNRFNLIDGECIIYWRFDGIIDFTKTADQMVLNSNIDIIDRFNIACMYCLDKSIQTLWAEMSACGLTENFVPADNSMACFWVRWLHEGSKVSWLQAAREYLEPLPLYWAMYISFFPLLRPEDRALFANSSQFSKCYNIRLGLLSATKEEEERILRIGAQLLLLLCLEWPLQSVFLETADTLWNFIGASDFEVVLRSIWLENTVRKDFDYCKLFVDFWNGSPQHLKESARHSQHLSEIIDLAFNEIRLREKDSSVPADIAKRDSKTDRRPLRPKFILLHKIS